MGPAFLALLSVKEWVPAHPAEVSYAASPTVTQETPPQPGNDPQGSRMAYMAFRFARVEAHSGDLLMRVVKLNGAAPTMGTGDIHVSAGTSEVFQLNDGDTVYLQGASGATTGAVIWGR